MCKFNRFQWTMFWTETVPTPPSCILWKLLTKIHQTIIKSSFYILLKFTWLSQLIYIRPSLYYIYFCTNVILWSNLRYRKLLPPHATFHRKKIVLLLFFWFCDMLQSHVLVECHTTGTNSSSVFFYMLYVANIY